MALICARLVTSTANPSTTSPFNLSCSTAPWTASSFTSATATTAPSSRNLRAVANPMPCAAPVMMATLFFNLTRAPGSTDTAERKHFGRVVRKVGKFVVGSFDYPLAAIGIPLDHRAPVDHLVAGRRDQEKELRMRDARHLEREQFVEVFRFHLDRGVRVEHGLSPEVRLEVLVRPDRRVEQDCATAEPFSQPGRVVPTQRGTDQCKLLGRFKLCGCECDLRRR